MSTVPTVLHSAELACQKCGATAFKTSWQTFRDGTRHIRMDCSSCGSFVHYAKQHETAPEPRFEPCRSDASKPARAAPPTSWEWIGLIRQADGNWRPVAKAPTLGRCWDALLHYPGDGDMLCVPSEPIPRRPGVNAD